MATANSIPVDLVYTDETQEESGGFLIRQIDLQLGVIDGQLVLLFPNKIPLYMDRTVRDHFLNMFEEARKKENHNYNICRCGHHLRLHGDISSGCSMPGCKCRGFISKDIFPLDELRKKEG